MKLLNYVFVLILIISAIVIQILQYRANKKGKIFTIDKSIDTFCNQHYKKIWCFFIVLLLISVIYQFGTLPVYIGVDEAAMAYDAHCIANYGTDRYLNSFPVYLPNFGNGQSVLCCYMAAFFIKILGSNIFAYRIPALLVYLVGLVASYLLVAKAKNKKTALIFTFFIITCPWNIFSPREALDCNLYAGMFMLSLWLMQKAEKNYQYLLAGLSVGITLYTYCLSWITMPFFLVVWSIYMLWVKKIKIKQICLFALPIILLAMPLIYFLLVNFGIAHTTKIGIFTFPVLEDFRASQIAIKNIWETGLESIKVIFFTENAIYPAYVLLFLLGFIIGIKKTYRAIKQKQYSITAVFVIAFTTLFLGLLCTPIRTANKANVLYIPILYFVVLSVLEIVKYSKWLCLVAFVFIAIFFIQYELKYYFVYAQYSEMSWYTDQYLIRLTEEIEENEIAKNCKKYVMVDETSPYIYTALSLKMSPYEFMDTWQQKEYYGVKETHKLGNYYYYNYYIAEDKEKLKQIDFSQEKGIIILSMEYNDVVSYMEEKGYDRYQYGNLYVFVT